MQIYQLLLSGSLCMNSAAAARVLGPHFRFQGITNGERRYARHCRKAVDSILHTHTDQFDFRVRAPPLNFVS